MIAVTTTVCEAIIPTNFAIPLYVEILGMSNGRDKLNRDLFNSRIDIMGHWRRTGRDRLNQLSVEQLSAKRLYG